LSQGATLLGALALAQQHGASLLALRAGQAIDRVTRLIRLLAPASGGDPLVRIALPPLRDMADITALTVETVSRSLSGMRRRGLLESDGPRRGRGDKTCRCLAAERGAMA
jgi:DNA-binding IclR family transcriptional regulator